MSHSTVYAVYATRVHQLAEYSNGWGSAPPLWDYLWNTYIDTTKQSTWLTSKGWEKLWDLRMDRRIEECLRLCLAWTFDNAVIRPRNRVAMAKACNETHGILRTRTEWTWSHWPAFADILRTANPKRPQRLLGFGLSCTSVSDPWIQRQPYTSVWDVLKECRKPTVRYEGSTDNG